MERRKYSSNVLVEYPSTFKRTRRSCYVVWTDRREIRGPFFGSQEISLIERSRWGSGPVRVPRGRNHHHATSKQSRIHGIGSRSEEGKRDSVQHERC